ncbi:MAG: ribosome biogenesis GTPase Der [Burkholderiaceae bacterium]|nr:ribosome biogenesis GTPase Der [Burkholderiaceae bacterium]
MALLPVVALVGRPNVGKSTLFNRLTRSRSALVADAPGLTRDRQYGRGRVGEIPFIVIDSGGFEPVARDGIAALMARQTRQAIVEADVVVFLVDGREGLTGRDREIADELRRTARRVLLAVNKTEGRPRDQAVAEFHELGLGDPWPVSAAHGDGVRELVDAALEPFVARAAEASEGDEAAQAPGDAGEETRLRRAGEQTRARAAGEAAALVDAAAPAAPEGAAARVRVAVVGRPNVGKSTLINALLGEERLVAFDQPGTTRDAVAVDFEHGGRAYTLIDTAGLRRRSRVDEAIEKFSVVKTLQAIEQAHVCILLLDASQEVSDQDASIAGYVLEAGRALVVAVNKWDLADAGERERVRTELDRKLHFLRFAKWHFVSAREGFGIPALMRSVQAAHAAAMAKLSTPKLTRALREAVERQPPPRRGMSRPKPRYAHQGGQNPPVVIVHGSALDGVPDAYRRYLESWLRERFALTGTPLRIEFRSGSNPYAPRT